MDFSIFDVLKAAWRKLKGQWRNALVISAIVSAFTVGFTHIVMPHLGEFGAFLSLIWMLLVMLPITTGMMWYFLAVHDGKSVTVKNLFDVFKDYGRFILGTLRIAGVMFLVILLAGILLGILMAMTGTFNWFLILLAMIPILAIMLKYSQFYFLLKDYPTKMVSDLIAESKAMMNGRRLKFVGMNAMIFIAYIPTFALTIYALILFNNSTTVSSVAGMVVITNQAVFERHELITTINSIIAPIIAVFVLPFLYTAWATFYRKLTVARDAGQDHGSLEQPVESVVFANNTPPKAVVVDNLGEE